MLYLNLNTRQIYTAHQALDSYDIDFVPLRLPSFSQSELNALYASSFSQIVAKLLNLFFGKNITDCAIEHCLKINPLIPDYLDRRTLLIKLKRDRNHGILNLANSIYNTMSEKQYFPGSWAAAAIQISILFGIYADMRRWGFQCFDIALDSDAYMALVPVYFAKKMGLPIKSIIVGSSVEDDIWKLLHTGKICDPHYFGYLACFLHGYDSEEAERYLAACNNKTNFELSTERLQELTSDLFSAIVSTERSKDLIGNIGRTYGKQISSSAAVSYGALQDYRAVTGENNTTLIVMEEF